MKKIVINGKVFKRKNITGLQRYVIEILKEMDKLITDEDIELLVPKINYNLPDFKNIKIKKTINLQEILWEQIILPIYAISHKKIILNMANNAPIVKPDIIVIHDIAPIKQKDNFKLLKRLYYKVLYFFNIKNAKKIITVSEFSKKEIKETYKIKDSKIDIVYNSWQHMKNIPEEKINGIIEKKPYFFSIGTLAKHKNIKWVIEVAKRNPKYNFLISGLKDSKNIDKQLGIQRTSNVKYMGYLTDGQMKTILKSAEALIFSSFYEGFGIPPLEALAVNTKVIISDIPVLKETCENTAYYINPYKTNIDLEELLNKKVEKSDNILKKYSWEKSAQKLFKIMKEEKYENSNNT